MPTVPAIIDVAAAGRLAHVREYLGKKFKKISQGEIARKCGTVQSSISKMERGVIEIPTYFLKALFIHYNINPSYVIIGPPEPIEYKKESKTLITDTRELRAEIEIMNSKLKKLEGDFRILSHSLNT